MFTFPECTLLSQFLQFQWSCFPKQHVISFKVPGLRNTISVTGHFSFSVAGYYKPLAIFQELTGVSMCDYSEDSHNYCSVCLHEPLHTFDFNVCLIWQDGNTAGRKTIPFKQMPLPSKKQLGWPVAKLKVSGKSLNTMGISSDASDK